MKPRDRLGLLLLAIPAGIVLSALRQLADPDRPTVEVPRALPTEAAAALAPPVRPAPPLPADPLSGRHLSARARLDAYRRGYREQDWASNFYLLRALVVERERETLRATGAETSWREPSPTEAAELTRLVNRARRLSTTAATRRAAEIVAARAFNPRE